MAQNDPAAEANILVREYLKSRKNLPRLHDKVCVVTGSGSLQGIGRQAVIAFCEHGAKAVYAVDIASQDDFASLRGLCAEFEATKLITIYGDASDEASVSSVCRRAVQEFGRLDVFFANAGISSTECRLAGIASVF
jgi:NAD(P)-dependent dehydrogenase (short-subunit alcohol dehydrogenase family)